MSLAGTLAGAAAPHVMKKMFEEYETPGTDEELELQYLRATDEMRAWAMEEQSDLLGMVLSGGVGLVGALFTPLPNRKD